MHARNFFFSPQGGLQRRAIRLIGDPALSRLLQPLSHRRGGVLLVTSNSSPNCQTYSLHVPLVSCSP
nr:unnamed protein product [Callosobruchus chinensis]